MDRTRESRRSSLLPAVNPFPRRRHRTTALRDSSEEGQMELQETVRLRGVPIKKDRDRDSFNRNKRRRGSHKDEGDHSTEESVGNEQDQESSASDQNHRRSFTPATPLRPTPPPPWKITDEIIGVVVPRKARSASVKRPHDTCGGGGGDVEEQSAEAVSPSSSNVSDRKKMKTIEPETRVQNTAKSSSSTHENIEIEIAELLYGLMTCKNQESSSQKLEASDTSFPPQSTSPSSSPFENVEKKNVEDYNSSTLVPNNSTAESCRIGSKQPAKVEKEMLSPGCNGDNTTTAHETGSSEGLKENIVEDNLNSGAGCGDTTEAEGRSVSFTGESPSCSKSKLDVDKQDSASTRKMSAVPEGNNSQRGDKFEIDLMAPPPMASSPERDESSRGDFISETKALALDVEMKEEDSVKVEEKVERLVKKEKTHEEIEGVKMDGFEEKWDVLKPNLEKPNKQNDIATSNKFEEQDIKKEQPTKLTNTRVENTVQSSSTPLSTSVPGWSSILSPLGYMPPLQTDVKTDKTTGSATAPQHVNFVLSQPRPKRCATHHYIARNIFLHQQFTKMNPILPADVGTGCVCSTKSDNVNGVLSAESMVVGKQSQKHSAGMNQNAELEKGWAATSDPSLTASKSFDIANPTDSTQRKQLVLHQRPHPGSTGNLVNQASVATATSQAGAVNSTSSASSSNKSLSSAAGSLGTSSTCPAVSAAMSFSYPNLAANDAPYVTIVQNNGYPFPFSTPLGATAAIRGAGANPAQATPILNGPFYSSQMFHPLQHPQQYSYSQAVVQPSYLNSSTSSDSSSSHKQPQGTQVNGNNILTSTTMQIQQSQKQHTSLSHCKHQTEMGGENAPSVAGRTSYSQKNVFGQNFTIPVQPMNFSFRPSATSDSVSGNSGNFGDKQQRQQALKGGVELIPSQAFAFAAFNGTSVPSTLNFSSMGQNPVIFQSLPDIAWQGYQPASRSYTTAQQKIYSITEGKSKSNLSHQDDDKKASSGKPSTNAPTTLVFDNSSENLNFVLSSTNGNWSSRSIVSTATMTSLLLSSNASNCQQLSHLQKQQSMQQHQPAMATRYKASSTNNTAAIKFVNNLPVFAQNLTQCRSSNQASQSKSLGRTPDSQVHNSSIISSTTPPLKSFSQEQGRVLQGHTQISFGGNYISSLPPQGQQLLNSNQPLSTTVAGTPPNGVNLKPTS